MKAPVDIHDGSGSLSVIGVQGDLTIAKESGDIAVERVTGMTKINSQSGQMKLRNLAQLDIEHSDGNLDMMMDGRRVAELLPKIGLHLGYYLR